MKLPLKVRRVHESYQITDAVGRGIFLYFEDDPFIRSAAKERWSPEEAEALAKRIARLLTDDEQNREH
ncbi:hypothetical protein OIU35_31455 [Boseaceae bacterium BT-24-1]|nr:hypothetical protein [Boseaceae bacterium BT-24-1]